MPRMTQAEWNAYEARRSRSATTPGQIGVFNGPGFDAVSDESALHNEIVAYCRGRGWICFHGSMAKRTARNLGEPDMCVVTDGGRVYFVELKTKTGKLSPEQASTIAWLTKLGANCAVVRSMGEFLELVKVK